MNTLEYVLQQAINAVSQGSLFALVAIGLSIIFSLLRLTNFAHGDMMMIGAYATLLMQFAGLPFTASPVDVVAMRPSDSPNTLTPFSWGPRVCKSSPFLAKSQIFAVPSQLPDMRCPSAVQEKDMMPFWCPSITMAGFPVESKILILQSIHPVTTKPICIDEVSAVIQ